MKLEHVSGSVRCSEGSLESRWGCNNNPETSSYTREVIGTVITDDLNNPLLQQRTIAGYDGMSDFVIFNKQDSSAPRVSSLPYVLRIWYNEDLADSSEYDNSGVHQINVYVTVVPELPSRRGKTQTSGREI